MGRGYASCTRKEKSRRSRRPLSNLIQSGRESVAIQLYSSNMKTIENDKRRPKMNRLRSRVAHFAATRAYAVIFPLCLILAAAGVAGAQDATTSRIEHAD